VVGSHAHVLVGSGFVDGAYVSFGLGNFIFYARGGLGAQTGVLTLTMRGRAVTGVRWTPAVISGGVPVPLSDAAAERAVASWRALRSCTGLAANP
jgi:poly-gamma-glutamate capsule biosynthesis protein CapA/YwtB (metallophosphatase superfamily)